MGWCLGKMQICLAKHFQNLAILYIVLQFKNNGKFGKQTMVTFSSCYFDRMDSKQICLFYAPEEKTQM